MFLWTIFAAGVLGGVAYYLYRHPELFSRVPFIASFAPLARSGVGGGGQSSPAPLGPRAVKVSRSEAVARLATAIARFETGYRGTGFPLDPKQWKGRAAKNNNPGNLRYAAQRGSTGRDAAGYAIFRMPQDGWTALLREVENDMTQPAAFPGDAPGPTGTLAEFIAAYAPASENPTSAYIAFVSAELGISPQTRFVDWVSL